MLDKHAYACVTLDSLINNTNTLKKCEEKGFI